MIITMNVSSLSYPVQADDGFQVEIVLRLQCKDLSWTWIYIQANKDSECQGISCTNFIIRYDKLHFSSRPELTV